MSYIKITDSVKDPIRIYYEDLGAGSPVVLIHGWPLDHQMWEYQLNALVEAGHRVIAYDRRGFGQSSRPWDGYDYDTLASDLNALIETLDLHDVTLVGFSMGGGEVVRYISTYGSDRISRIALLGAVTPSMKKSAANPDGIDQEVFDGMMEKIKEDRNAFLTDFGKQFFGVGALNKPVSSEMLDYHRQIASFASPRATQECAKSFSQTAFEKDMKAITVPTLIIHGDSDKTVPIETTGERAAAMIPGSKFIRYDGAPHGFFYTHRDKLNNDLLEFLATQHVVKDYSSVKYS